MPPSTPPPAAWPCWALDGEIVQANQALADFLGRSVESLVGTGWGALIEPSERQRYTKQVAELVEGDVWSFQAETRFVLRDRRVHFGLVGMSLVGRRRRTAPIHLRPRHEHHQPGFAAN